MFIVASRENVQNGSTMSPLGTDQRGRFSSSKNQWIKSPGGCIPPHGPILVSVCDAPSHADKSWPNILCSLRPVGIRRVHDGRAHRLRRLEYFRGVIR